MKTTTSHDRVRTNISAQRLHHAIRAGVILMGAAALLVSASSRVLQAGENPGNANPRVLPPQSTPHGKTYGEWGAIYWQWLLSFPADASPTDEQGEVVYGAQNQSGPVWILESGGPGVWERQVSVPPGKALLFSITGGICSTLSSPGASEQDLLDCVTADFNGLTIFASAEVDGVPMSNVAQYFVTSPLFSINVPEDSWTGLPSGTGQAIAKGWFFILVPPSKGQHTIRVRARIVELPQFDGDTTYHVTVK